MALAPVAGLHRVPSGIVTSSAIGNGFSCSPGHAPRVCGCRSAGGCRIGQAAVLPGPDVMNPERLNRTSHRGSHAGTAPEQRRCGTEVAASEVEIGRRPHRNHTLARATSGEHAVGRSTGVPNRPWASVGRPGSHRLRRRAPGFSVPPLPTSSGSPQAGEILLFHPDRRDTVGYSARRTAGGPRPDALVDLDRVQRSRRSPEHPRDALNPRSPTDRLLLARLLIVALQAPNLGLEPLLVLVRRQRARVTHPPVDDRDKFATTRLGNLAQRSGRCIDMRRRHVTGAHRSRDRGQHPQRLASLNDSVPGRQRHVRGICEGLGAVARLRLERPAKVDIDAVEPRPQPADRASSSAARSQSRHRARRSPITPERPPAPLPQSSTQHL